MFLEQNKFPNVFLLVYNIARNSMQKSFLKSQVRISILFPSRPESVATSHADTSQATIAPVPCTHDVSPCDTITNADMRLYNEKRSNSTIRELMGEHHDSKSVQPGTRHSHATFP